MQEREYHFKVKTIEAGQRRKYGDSYYHFEVEDLSESGLHEAIVKNFCMSFLQPAKSREAKREWHESYVTEFKKVGDRKYSYKVTQPSTH